MKYLILRKQAGEGCDYSIGCGLQYAFKEFDGTLDEALEHFTTWVAYGDDQDELCFQLEDETDLEKAYIIPYGKCFEVDLDKLRAAYVVQKKEASKSAEVKDEKRELARLKAKYETE